MAKLVLPCLISLKGYVGGLDFDSSKVNKELAKTEVNIEATD